MDYAVLLLVPETADALKILSDLNYKVFNMTHQNAIENNNSSEKKLKMILELAKKHPIDLQMSFTIGEWGTDIVAGRLAGTRTILIIDKDEIIPVIEVDNVVYSLREAVEWIVEISQVRELSLH